MTFTFKNTINVAPPLHFESDSFPIRIDNHALYCMANSPHLFYDLILSDVYKINGIHEGLAILGKGTFRFSISDDDGRVHPIRIPNSPYLPKLQGVQFALNGKIPKKLALIKLPKCTGCLFCVMTKIPWRGKESKSSHKIFAQPSRGRLSQSTKWYQPKWAFSPSMHLRSSPPSTAFASTTTTVTMAFMPTTPSRNHARAVVRDLLSVG